MTELRWTWLGHSSQWQIVISRSLDISPIKSFWVSSIYFQIKYWAAVWAECNHGTLLCSAAPSDWRVLAAGRPRCRLWSPFCFLAAAGPGPGGWHSGQSSELETVRGERDSETVRHGMWWSERLSLTLTARQMSVSVQTSQHGQRNETPVGGQPAGKCIKGANKRIF